MNNININTPANCQHLDAKVNCMAVHPSHPECDCRWCVYNREFNQANDTL